MENARAQIVKAFKGSKKLRIVGYVTSKKEVTNYTVELIGYEGYRSLLQQSLDATANMRSPEHFGTFSWQEATAQQHASWRNSLNGGVSRTAGPVLEPAAEGAYYTRSDRPEAVVLQHLRVIESEGITAKTSNHRDDVTAAKAWLRDNTPISHYAHMFILEPGKFESVTAI